MQSRMFISNLVDQSRVSFHRRYTMHDVDDACIIYMCVKRYIETVDCVVS